MKFSLMCYCKNLRAEFKAFFPKIETIILIYRAIFMEHSIFYPCPLFSWIILKQDLYSAPVTHPSSSRVPRRKLPWHGGTHRDPELAPTEDTGLWSFPFNDNREILWTNPISTFNRVINLLMKMFYDWGEKIPCTVIDSSGFIDSYASHYYSWRTGKIRKPFLKTAISVDTDQQIITGLKISNHPIHDILHA